MDMHRQLAEQAERCLRLAAGATDRTLARTLLDLAAEYSVRAEAAAHGDEAITDESAKRGDDRSSH